MNSPIHSNTNMNTNTNTKKEGKKRSISFNTPFIDEDFFFFKQTSLTHLLSKVTLYSNFITIEPQDYPDRKCKIEMDFDTIYGVLQKFKDEEEEKSFSGCPYGIRFEKFGDSIEIHNYDFPNVILKWQKLLSKFFNQRNFHNIFKPLKKIGKGNFATVYLVSKHEDKNLYAVKAFSKENQFNDERGKQSIINEIKIMRALDHPNLMKLEGVYETENSIYFVVEYLKGGLLYDKIRRRHTFITDQVIEIMSSILKGLVHMHEKRIMHRDLKPENILFRNQISNECAIADFGLATFVDEKEYIYTRCGTPGYVAPQISNLKNHNTHYESVCDIFSLGVIFHILILGTSPFPGKECDEVMMQNRQCNIDFSSQLYNRLHPTWLDLLRRMLEKDPQKRITASQSLKHQFFTMTEATILQQLQIDKNEECDSPLMITKNKERKRNIKLRDDSCLKLKMREHVAFYRQQEEQNIDKINSPLKKKIVIRKDKKSKTTHPSNFKE